MKSKISIIWLLCLNVIGISTCWANSLLVKTSCTESYTVSRQDLIEKLPITSFSSVSPWNSEKVVFSGIKVGDMAALFLPKKPTSLYFKALNEFTSSISFSETTDYSPIIAYSMNHEPISVRKRGPFMLVYNLDAYPFLDQPEFHDKMIWQISEVSIEECE